MKAAREQDSKNKKLFFALQFVHLPFPEIDKYVCVPDSWIIHTLESQIVLASYPTNEDVCETRTRTKNREPRKNDWRLYAGLIKFQSENYEEVVQWIEKMIAKEDNQEEKSKIEDPSSDVVVSRQPRSSKNPFLSDTLLKQSHRAVKLCDNPRRPLPKMWISQPPALRPWQPNPIQSNKPAVISVITPWSDIPVIVENQNTQNPVNDHSKQEFVDTSAKSPSKLPGYRQLLPKPAGGKEPQCEQLSMPDINNPDEEIEIEVESETIEKERPPSSKQTQPSLALDYNDYSLIESRLHEIHSGQPQQAKDTLKTSLLQKPTVNPPRKANKPYNYAQIPVSTPSSKSQLQGTVGTTSKLTPSYQNSQLHDFGKPIPSITYYAPKSIDLSSQRQIPAVKRKSSATIINTPVEKKARVENITQNISTLTQSLYDKELPSYADSFGDQRHLQNMDTSAAQNLSFLTHQKRLYEPPQVQYLQQTLQIPCIDLISYLPNPVTRYTPQQPNQINSSQFLPHQCQLPLVSTNQIPELMRPVSTPSVATENQLRRLENLPRHDPPSYQDPRTIKLLKSQSICQSQVTEERPIALPKTNQKLLIDQGNNSRKDLLAKRNLSSMKCLEICPAPETGQNFETQTTSKSQETQYKVPDEKNPDSKKLVPDQTTKAESYNRRRNKPPNPSIADERSIDIYNLMPEVKEKLSEQAKKELLKVHGLLLTKMYENFVNTEEYYNNLRVTVLGCLKLYEILLNKCKKDNVINSHPNSTSSSDKAKPDNRRRNETPNSPESMESRYDTDKHPMQELQPLTKIADSEMVSADEELLDNDSTADLDCENEDYSEEDAFASIVDERSIDIYNLIPEGKKKLYEQAKKELLEVHGLLLTKMYENFVKTEEYYNNSRVTVLGCLKLYKILSNKYKKDNVINSDPNSTSNASEVP